MKNSSKSLQQLNEANFNMPNGLMSCNLNAENILEEAIATGQAPQCDIYDGLRLRTEFWHLWQQYQDYHYSRCLQWMGGNVNDAEDSLSRAMLKAWKKWPTYRGKITNPKGWLTILIYNLCMDIHRQRKKSEQRVESIEEIEFSARVTVSCSLESPESEICRREMRAYLHQTIFALPPRLRDAFILRYCQQKSYRHIAKQLLLSEDNVYKRVQQARTIVRKQLSKYLAGKDDTFLSQQPYKWVIPSQKESNFDQTVIFEWEAAMASPNPGIATQNIVDEINYKVTAICLKTLPHSWYSSLNPLRWR